MSTCSHCASPIVGVGHAGRPWPGRVAAVYCCFGCLSLGEHRLATESSPERASSGWKLDGLAIRLGIAVLIAGQSMIFGLALNMHDDVSAESRWIAQSGILCATVLVIALLGGPLFRSAWTEIRRGRLTIEALFLLTMIGAMAASLQAHITGQGAIYFEVVSVLLVVYTLGNMIGARARTTAIERTRAWSGQLDTCRIVDTANRTRLVPVTTIVPGDVIEVDPGEMIAVDGSIQTGTGFVSEAALRGEPFPIVRRPGDRVLAGAISYDAAFRIVATAHGTARQIDRTLDVLSEARDGPLPLQSQADRLGRWFFPVVVVTAIVAFGYWTWFAGAGWEAGLFHAMSVLLVACPCAIGLATPIIVWSTLSRLAERGLIVRSANAIERLAEVDFVLLDKTGTLTEEQFALRDIVTAALGDERSKILGWLSMIEARSSHPVARAFARLPRSFADGEEPRIDSLRVVPGRGVEAWVEEATGERHWVRIGQPDWIEQYVHSEEDAPALVRSLCATGHRIDVAIDGHLAVVAVVAERLRGSAAEMLEEWKRLGVPVELLTGDTAARVEPLDVPIRANLLPADKQERVEELARTGHKPLMVGDGINDAVALNAAHFGVALSSGTDLAVGAADITLYNDDLRVLPWAVQLSRAALHAVNVNLYRAVIYNLIGMALAACGVLHPVVAVLLMMVSSLSLIVSATRFYSREEHCTDAPPARRARRRYPSRLLHAVVHAAAVILQGVAVLLLIESARSMTVGAIALGSATLVGLGLAYLWHRWAAIPHWIDMIFAMLTLGNLGMLVGWWADNRFTPLHDAACCCSGSGVSRGMWFGMLVCGTIAMLALGRRPLPRDRWHIAAMLTGGNVGMIMGMMGGASLASELHLTALGASFAVSVAAMSGGMVAGMLLGTWVTQTGIELIRCVAVLPRWLHRPTHTAG